MNKIRNLYFHIRFGVIVLWMFVSSVGMTACSQKEEVMFVESSCGEKADEEENAASAQITSTDQSEETGMVVTEGEAAEKGRSTDAPSLGETKQMAYIVVHVCGAVKCPGVYELAEKSRVIDAVTAAGGMTESADGEYVNLATILSDGDKVRIPTKEEVTKVLQANGEQNDIDVITTRTAQKSDENTQDYVLVNINTADVGELCKLPGIGQTRAESIVAYRMEHGAFSSIEDIMLVSGIKESSFQKIKDMITV